MQYAKAYKMTIYVNAYNLELQPLEHDGGSLVKSASNTDGVSLSCEGARTSLSPARPDSRPATGQSHRCRPLPDTSARGPLADPRQEAVCGWSSEADGDNSAVPNQSSSTQMDERIEQLRAAARARVENEARNAQLPDAVFAIL